MTVSKRIFDVVLALLLLIPVVPLSLALAALIWLREGRPVFYLSERMRSADTSFLLLKFRTMQIVAQDSGVSGQDKAHRITPSGAMLRRTRLDELPQLWNILRGDMSFVGPRPPLRQYVEMFPELYAQVLVSRPGVTGLATLLFKDIEARLLATSSSADETEAIYVRRCVPRKAALDLVYQRNRSLCWDVLLVFATIFPRLPKVLAGSATITDKSRSEKAP